MICSKVVIINEGKIVLEESLRKLSEDIRNTQKLLLKVRQSSSGIIEKIIALKDVSDIKPGSPGEYIIEPRAGADIREEVSGLVIENNWGLLELRPLAHTLEEIFLKVISSADN